MSSKCKKIVKLPLSLYDICVARSRYELLPAESLVPEGYPLYKQCDPRWAEDVIGINAPATDRKTVCAVGCLMSSTSMALAQRGILIDGKPSTPGSLNTWLRANGGYLAGTNDLEESAVAGVSPTRISWTNSSMHRTNDLGKLSSPNPTQPSLNPHPNLT